MDVKESVYDLQKNDSEKAAQKEEWESPELFALDTNLGTRYSPGVIADTSATGSQAS